VKNPLSQGSRSSKPPPARRPRGRPERNERLLSEARIHWGRGIAIILGMAAIIVTFFIVLSVVPKPGTGNPIDTLTNFLNTASNTAATPVSGTAVAGAAQAGASAPPLATVTATARAVGSSTPGAQFVAVAARGAPNVRIAPSTNNNPLGNLQPGREVVVLGRSADNAWLQIVWDNNTKAWVAADLMRFVVGDPSRLPVVAP
jgi:hypothetical protein